MTPSIPTTSTTDLSRRNLFRLGAVGTAAVATTAVVAAPAKADPVWSEEFMTRIETHQGFDLHNMTPTQVDNAKFIIAIGKAHGVDALGIQMAIATSIVEAWLYNYGPEVDHDSGGMFQQRPATGWGTYDQVRNKKLATEAFLGFAPHTNNLGLMQVRPDYHNRPFSDACQAVQVSAHPERYGQQEGAARQIWDWWNAEVAPFQL